MTNLANSFRGDEGCASDQILKKKQAAQGLTGSQFLEGVAWKEESLLFSGGLQFMHKKSEICKNKKSL